ncbi:dipeptidyl-peptidase 3 family protein [Christiangramia sabulilitoris]|uniref:Zn-dependent hydrolase n=1 Tax=Christiangramia sabulilitoris TaxID=2583991 RepID=A0A550HXA5_9FLAO|nr:Zn-dependent hydrolase [Christiangramia sabulilitoris]TRO63326.1 Zn-dependent hydrolase [Christiangramia sabulilitoris]
MNRFVLIFMFAVISLSVGCKTEKKENNSEEFKEKSIVDNGDNIQELLDQYDEVELSADISKLSEKQRKMIPLLIEVAKITDELFWYQAFGGQDSLLANVDDRTAEYVRINYGPWDRLNNMKPFIKNYGEKPAGANFYPVDMAKEEFENANLPNKQSLYTFIRRDEEGNLKAIWYHEMFPEKLNKASELLKQAAELAEDDGLKNYLNLRAKAFITDDYYESDVAWMKMKNNTIDMVTGPIETYEDRLFGYKAAFESYILIKDDEWSKRLEKYVSFLPMLQRELPVDPEYKKDNPGTDSDLNAYDVVYYAGDCNAGSKTIAINLPNDEKVQENYGSRRSQLKNAMKAKYDQILVPISKQLIAPEQQKNITFDAFFANTMFHEVAHGLGIKNTINNTGTVREALKDYAGALEEGKADVLGVYMITKLHEMGELNETDLMDYYVTFLAGIFRSVRFGASSAHGKANMVRFNYFKNLGAFTQNDEGYYEVDELKFRMAIDALTNDILVLQGDGDYQGTGKLFEENGKIDSSLAASLNKLSEKNIPVDIIFKQGIDVLGL